MTMDLPAVQERQMRIDAVTQQMHLVSFSSHDHLLHPLGYLLGYLFLLLDHLFFFELTLLHFRLEVVELLVQFAREFFPHLFDSAGRVERLPLHTFMQTRLGVR